MVGTNDGSSCHTDFNSVDFTGSLDELKELLKLHQDIKSGKVSVVRHRTRKA
jgi:glutaredoxin-related protein